jgi:hypothetical protein
VPTLAGKSWRAVRYPGGVAERLATSSYAPGSKSADKGRLYLPIHSKDIQVDFTDFEMVLHKIDIEIVTLSSTCHSSLGWDWKYLWRKGGQLQRGPLLCQSSIADTHTYRCDYQHRLVKTSQCSNIKLFEPDPSTLIAMARLVLPPVRSAEPVPVAMANKLPRPTAARFAARRQSGRHPGGNSWTQV